MKKTQQKVHINDMDTYNDLLAQSYRPVQGPADYHGESIIILEKDVEPDGTPNPDNIQIVITTTQNEGNEGEEGDPVIVATAFVPDSDGDGEDDLIEDEDSTDDDKGGGKGGGFKGVASYVYRSVKQVVMGEFGDEEDETALGTVLEIAVGFVPIVETIQDFKDLAGSVAKGDVGGVALAGVVYIKVCKPPTMSIGYQYSKNRRLYNILFLADTIGGK